MSGSRMFNSIYLYAIAAILLSFTATLNSLFLLPAAVLVPAIIAKIFYENDFFSTIYSLLAIIIFGLMGSYVNKINNTLSVLLYSVVITIPGIIIGFAFEKKFNFKNILIFSAAFDILVVLIIFATFKYMYGINVTSVIRKYIVNSYMNFTEIMEVYNPQILAAFHTDKYEVFNMFYMVLPGLVPFAVLFLVFTLSLLRYIAAKILCNRTLILKSNFFDGMDKFNISLITNIVCSVSLLILLFDSNSKITMIALNILFSVLTIYFFNAISLVDFKLKQHSASYIRRIIIFIILIPVSVVTLAIFPVANIFYLGVFIGFLDGIFDYRKLNSKEGETNEK